ncbi:MAG: hypothetical protein V3W41_09510 [Planctomycetota bacterium]
MRRTYLILSLFALMPCCLAQREIAQLHLDRAKSLVESKGRDGACYEFFLAECANRETTDALESANFQKALDEFGPGVDPLFSQRKKVNLSLVRELQELVKHLLSKRCVDAAEILVERMMPVAPEAMEKLQVGRMRSGKRIPIQVLPIADARVVNCLVLQNIGFLNKGNVVGEECLRSMEFTNRAAQSVLPIAKSYQKKRMPRSAAWIARIAMGLDPETKKSLASILKAADKSSMRAWSKQHANRVMAQLKARKIESGVLKRWKLGRGKISSPSSTKAGDSVFLTWGEVFQEASFSVQHHKRNIEIILGTENPSESYRLQLEPPLIGASWYLHVYRPGETKSLSDARFKYQQGERIPIRLFFRSGTLHAWIGSTYVAVPMTLPARTHFGFRVSQRAPTMSTHPRTKKRVQSRKTEPIRVFELNTVFEN